MRSRAALPVGEMPAMFIYRAEAVCVIALARRKWAKIKANNHHIVCLSAVHGGRACEGVTKSKGERAANALSASSWRHIARKLAGL